MLGPYSTKLESSQDDIVLDGAASLNDSGAAFGGSQAGRATAAGFSRDTMPKQSREGSVMEGGRSTVMSQHHRYRKGSTIVNNS